MSRAVGRANESMAILANDTQDSASTKDATGGDALIGLVRSLQREQDRVHVDIPAGIAKISFGNLNAQSFPTSEATDKLASLVHKCKKKDIANPFPYMAIDEFVPSWAKEVCKLHLLMHVHFSTRARCLAGGSRNHRR